MACTYMIRMKKTEAAGLIYPDNILAFKLLKNCNVSEEAQSTVFAALQKHRDLTAHSLVATAIIYLENLLGQNEFIHLEDNLDNAEVNYICFNGKGE